MRLLETKKKQTNLHNMQKGINIIRTENVKQLFTDNNK